MRKKDFPCMQSVEQRQGRAGERGDGKEQTLSSMFYLHLHCSAVIAQRITAADVKGKNGFSQDGSDPLICPWGTAQMLGLGLHSPPPPPPSPLLIHVLSLLCVSVHKDARGRPYLGFFLGGGKHLVFWDDSGPNM